MCRLLGAAAGRIATAVCLAAGSLAAQPAAQVARSVPGTARIILLPRSAWTGAVARLRVDCPEPAPTAIRWTSSAGRLLWDDLREVEWRAPAAPGVVRLRARVTRGEESEEAVLDVDVRRPSTAGMVWVPAGSFARGDVLGSRNTKELKTIQNASDEPLHPVACRGFWIDRYPVTNEEYARWLGEARSRGLVRVTPVGAFGLFERSWVPLYYFESYEELIADYLATVNPRSPDFLHRIRFDEATREFRVAAAHRREPVVDVSWFGAAAYARYHGRRLPSEAQWERAARGDDGRRYPWGDLPPTPLQANVNYYLGTDPLPVGMFSPFGDSPFGVGDIVSGLFEWSADWFHPYFYGDYRSPLPLRDPRGPFWGKAHAVRGLPSALFYPGSIIDQGEVVSARYDWRFEFYVGDMFANSETTFRTVYEPEPPDWQYDDAF